MKKVNLLNFIFYISMLFIVALCLYGFATDCPNTAGYVNCGDPESWSFPNWFQKNRHERLHD
jgi:hypothetical protein